MKRVDFKFDNTRRVIAVDTETGKWSSIERMTPFIEEMKYTSIKLRNAMSASSPEKFIGGTDPYDKEGK